MSSSAFKKGLLAVGGIMSVAVLLRYTIVPDEDQLLKRMSPELRAEYERTREARRRQHEQTMSHIIDNAKSDKPIWDVDPSKPPKDSK